METVNVGISKVPEKDIVDMLIQTVYGEEGKTRYKHRDVPLKISQLTNSTFLTVRKGTRLLGTVNINKRTFQLADKGTEAYYIRYFSFLQNYRAKKIGNRTGKSSGVIKNELDRFFENGPEQTAGKRLYYAYVETDNERSARVCRDFGFIPARKLSTTIFSRFFPKNSTNVRVATSEDEPTIRHHLNSYYKDYCMYHDQKLFAIGNYFIIEEAGKIVAGVQANPLHWEIEELDGIDGKFFMHVLPHIPILRRAFNPKNYRFLGFDQLFCLPGYEDKLEILMSAALKQSGLYSGMLWADDDSHLYETISKKIDLGLVSKMKADIPGNIILKFVNYTAKETEVFQQKPAYICSFDLT